VPNEEPLLETLAPEGYEESVYTVLGTAVIATDGTESVRRVAACVLVPLEQSAKVVPLEDVQTGVGVVAGGMTLVCEPPLLPPPLQAVGTKRHASPVLARNERTKRVKLDFSFNSART